MNLSDPHGAVVTRGSHVVSVLVPLYKHEKTVERALGSLLGSDCARVELIVCDDASPDRSFDKAEAWVESHRDRFMSALVVRNGENLGITGNLNRLMRMATGEFVTLLASDDELTIGAVDVQCDYLEQNPGADFVFANCGLIDAQSRRLLDKVVKARRGRLIQRRTGATFDIVFNWSLPWSRLFARREAVIRLGPYISEHSFEDRWSTLKIVTTGRFGYLDRVVHLYRVRPADLGTAGLDQQMLLGDMRDVEQRMMAESTGLLHSLLTIRVRSSVDPDRHLTKRLPWLALRYAITIAHRLFVML